MMVVSRFLRASTDNDRAVQSSEWKCSILEHVHILKVMGLIENLLLMYFTWVRH